jgi:hypothetical protein
MRAPKTITLLFLSGCLFGGVGLLMRPVTALRPVRTQTGEVMHGPDGRLLMERDPLGEFRVNWDAYTCMIGGFVLFGWALARGCRYLYVRHRKHDTNVGS